MKLIEVFNQLSSGELSQVNIGGAEQGEISEDSYKQLVGHINLGLAALYTRFNLKENRLQLILQPDQTTYLMHSRFAVNGRRTNEPVRYIKDTSVMRFMDDVHKIERVLTDAGYELGLNDGKDPYSCFTTSALVLRVPTVMVSSSATPPSDLITDELTVVYRAAHTLLDVDAGGFDPFKTEVELPYSHLQALLWYVASRVNNPIGMTNEFHSGNSYAAKYEQECMRLENEGLEIDASSQFNKFAVKGFC